MENDRQAGALLLSQLKLVNEATVYFETVIYPAVYKGIYTCINDFVRESGWIGEISAYEDNEDYLWLAPRKWKCTEQQDNNCKQWFESVETENNEDDYTLAVMTGVAVQPGEWGFKTCLNMGEFGGSRKAGAAIKCIDSDYIRRLEKLGFRPLNKGEFFLPVKLDLELLRAAWVAHGAFSAQDDAFAPLRSALITLQAAIPILDEFIEALASQTAS